MPHEPSPLSAAARETLSGLTDITTAALPEPCTARISAQDGAIVVISDGASVTVELTHPIRLDAARLSEEITKAANEALEQARTQMWERDDGSPGAATSLTELGSRLVDAYDAELRDLDERIDRLAGQ